MARFMHQALLHFSKYRKTFIVIFIWTLGLFCGTFLYKQSMFFSLKSTSDLYISSSQREAFGFVFFLPFIISFIATSIRSFEIILFIIFYKGVTYAFSQFLLISTFTQAGWIVCLLMMFGNLCSAPLLLLYWIRSTRPDFKCNLLEKSVLTFVVFYIYHVDCHLISPMFDQLFHIQTY